MHFLFNAKREPCGVVLAGEKGKNVVNNQQNIA
jgi:hypothetical protein